MAMKMASSTISTISTKTKIDALLGPPTRVTNKYVNVNMLDEDIKRLDNLNKDTLNVYHIRKPFIVNKLGVGIIVSDLLVNDYYIARKEDKISKFKRYKGLYKKMTDIDNIRLAIKKSAKGKKNRKDVKKILANVDYYAFRLQAMFDTYTLNKSDYRVKEKKERGKLRKIYTVSFFPHRIMQHILMIHLEPKWTGRLTTNTYQSIKGRGPVKAKRKLVKDLQRLAGQRGYNEESYKKWATDKEFRKRERIFGLMVVKLDIKQFYPSINNRLLTKIALKGINNKIIYRILHNIINVLDGLPIGNYISQILGNLFLDDLDRYIKNITVRMDHYSRYCDDMVILVKGMQGVKRVLETIKSILKEHYGLELNKSSQSFSILTRKIDYLGYTFDHLGRVRLRKSIKKRFIKACKKPNNDKALASYWGYIKEARAWKLWKKHYKGQKTWLQKVKKLPKRT